MSNTNLFNLFNPSQDRIQDKTQDLSGKPQAEDDIHKNASPDNISFASQSALLFSTAANHSNKKIEPNSIRVLRLLDAAGKCNRAEFAAAYQVTYNISPSLALSEISKLERNGKIRCENPEPLKPQSKLRAIEITEAGRMELIKPSYLKTQVATDLIPGKVNLPTGLLALLDNMSRSGAVKYTEFMNAAAKQFSHAQGRTTLSGRIANMQYQNDFVRTYLDETNTKFIVLTEKGKSKLAKDRELNLIENQDSPKHTGI